jgi:CubicO group peptidase (beta-lactamase class C family)
MRGADDDRTAVSRGWVAPGFEPVRETFETQLRVDGSHSAQLAVYWRDEPVVDLVGGPELDAESITGVFSATKGAGAVVLGTRVRSGAIDLDERVGYYWPQFAQRGKREVTVRQLLSHQAGLVSVDGGLTAAEVLDSRQGATKLAAQRPAWRVGPGPDPRSGDVLRGRVPETASAGAVRQLSRLWARRRGRRARVRRSPI